MLLFYRVVLLMRTRSLTEECLCHPPSRGNNEEEKYLHMHSFFQDAPFYLALVFEVQKVNCRHVVKPSEPVGEPPSVNVLEKKTKGL